MKTSGIAAIKAVAGTTASADGGLVSDPSQEFSEAAVAQSIENLIQQDLTASNHKPIGVTAAKELISALHKITNDDGFNQDSVNELRWASDAHLADFTPAAYQALQGFIRRETATNLKPSPVEGVFQKDSSNPALPGYWAQTAPGRTYATVPGTVGEKPITPEMMRQGEFGDCWEIAMLDASVAKDPWFFKKAITKNADGTYSATFFAFGPDGKPTPTRVTVSGDLPILGPTEGPNKDGTIDGCKLAGVHCTDPSVLDPAIYEKLWAKFKGGYGPTEGDYSGAAARAMTHISREYNMDIFPDSNPDQIAGYLLRNKGKLLSAFTYCGNATQPADPQVSYNGLGIPPNHDLMIDPAEPVVKKNGEWCVKIHNPWGHLEPGMPNMPDEGFPGQKVSPPADAVKLWDGVDDGSFLFPMRDFIKYFAGIEAVTERAPSSEDGGAA